MLENGVQGEPVLTDITNADGKPACYRNGRQFTLWSHLCRQPWQTQEWIEGQRKTLRPAEFSRMILVEFAEGIGNFCEPEAWQNCISSDHKPLQPGSNHQVFVGLDLATSPRGDDCALCGVYLDGNKTKLAFHRVWKGRERLSRLQLKETVYPFLLEMKKNFNLAGVWFDPYQALSLAEDLRKVGIRCFEVQQSHSSRGPKDTALLDMINNRSLVLYPHPDIKNLSSQAQSKELGNGQIFLKKASGRSRIDILVSLANVADEPAKRGRGWAGQWNGEMGQNAKWIDSEGRIHSNEKTLPIEKSDNPFM